MRKQLLVLAGVVGLSGVAQAALTTITFGGGSTQVMVADTTGNGTTSTSGSPGANNNLVNNGTNPGGLADIVYGGVSLFNPLDAVRNSGFMVGTGNYADNYIGMPSTGNVTVTSVTNNGTQITVTGTYLNGAGGAVLGTWTRTYTFVSNDIVREVVAFTNTSGNTINNLRMHGAYDPDNGGFTQTDNSQGSNSGYAYAQGILRNNLNNPFMTAVLASNDAGLAVGFFRSQTTWGRGQSPACVGELLGTDSVDCFTGAGVSPSFADFTYGWAQQFASILNGGTVQSTVYHLFGDQNLNLTNALANIGNPPPPPNPGGVPEPSTWAMLGSALVAMGMYARRKC